MNDEKQDTIDISEEIKNGVRTVLKVAGKEIPVVIVSFTLDLSRPCKSQLIENSTAAICVSRGASVQFVVEPGFEDNLSPEEYALVRLFLNY